MAQSGSTTTFAGGLTQNNGGIVQFNGGAINGQVTISNGTISGTGTINGNLVVGTATLAPGFSPGTITITGNLVLSGASVLNVELGGLVQGTEYDWLNVQGSAALAGTLNVNNYAGFVPPAGSSYNFMSFASKTGNFATVNLNALPNLVYSGSAIALTLTQGGAVPVPLPMPVPLSVPIASPVVAIEERLSTVAKLVAEIKAEPDPKKDREPELEACP